MSNVISFEDLKRLRQNELDKNKKWVVAAVLCTDCTTRWIGNFTVDTPLFKLECPGCGGTESFASILPDDYLAKLKDPQ